MIDKPADKKADAADAVEAKAQAGVVAPPVKVDGDAEHQKALLEAHKLAVAAEEAQAKADQKAKSPEQAAADEAKQKAMDAHAKAMSLKPLGGMDGDTNVVDAKVMVPPGTDPAMAAGDYRAVKRSNDPSNPAYAPGEPTHPEAQTVKLSRVTRDSPTPVYTWVTPGMRGNYLRAGWSEDEV
jgi:hypothetical protein